MLLLRSKMKHPVMLFVLVGTACLSNIQTQVLALTAVSRFGDGGAATTLQRCGNRSSVHLPTTSSHRRWSGIAAGGGQSSFPTATRRTETALFASKIGFGLTSRRFFVKLGLASVVVLPLSLEAYSRAGTITKDFRTDEPLPNPDGQDSWANVEHATLIFHGAGGQDQYTDELLARYKDSPPTDIAIMLKWDQLSADILQASFNGQRYGRETAQKLLSQSQNLKSIHLIGISVGAFAADSASMTLRDAFQEQQQQSSAPTQQPFMQMTLLDPFQQKGIFGFNYGTKNFGKSADYAQQYLNTDDPVPSTNVPVHNAACFDITPLRPKDLFGHDWPVLYYARSNDVGIVPESERRKAGSVEYPEQ